MLSDLRFPALYIVDHPLIQHKLSHMRMVDTKHQAFRQLLKEIAMLMGYEITRSLPTMERSIQTPITQMSARVLDGFRPVIVPILRAGLGMAEGLLELMPDSPEGHIGIYRDPKTKMAIEYLVKLPPLEGREVILVDPMLATGHSAIHAVEVLKRHGVPEEKIRFMVLVAAPEGVEVFTRAHPEVKVFTAALDERLNEHAYIVPGLGDAGDRLYATK